MAYPFLQTFTTATLRYLQHGAVWQLPLQGVADASPRHPPGLHHLYYSMSKNVDVLCLHGTNKVSCRTIKNISVLLFHSSLSFYFEEMSALKFLPVKRPSSVRRSMKRLLCELFTNVVTFAGLTLRFRRFKATLW